MKLSHKAKFKYYTYKMYLREYQNDKRDYRAVLSFRKWNGEDKNCMRLNFFDLNPLEAKIMEANSLYPDS